MEHFKRGSNKLEGGSHSYSHSILNRLLGKFKNLVDNFSSDRLTEEAEFEPEMSQIEPINLQSKPAEGAEEPDQNTAPQLQIHSTLAPNHDTNLPEADSLHHPPPDMRYCGQFLTPDELPAFCDQLHQLVEVVRYIQGYAMVTGEYPRALELRVAAEARELSALLAESRAARDAVSRARAQRAALRRERRETLQILRVLRDEEILEMETEIRTADPRLYREWIRARDSLSQEDMDELASKLQCKLNAIHQLEILISWRRSRLPSQASVIPRPMTPININAVPGSTTSRNISLTTPRIRSSFKKHGNTFKRHRKEPNRPAPITLEQSQDNIVSPFVPTTSYSISEAPNSSELITRNDLPVIWLPPIGPDSNMVFNVSGTHSLVPTPPPFPSFRFGSGLFSQLEMPEDDRQRTDRNRNVDVILVSLDASGNVDD